jgi:Zn-dependent M28 family amino/carboxypeptidase
VLATLPGLDKSSNATYIVGAHYDSYSPDPNDSPGATDNAIGCAIVLELAQIMSRYSFNHTLVFAFWNGEDVADLGSTDYLLQIEDGKPDIRLYLNIDSSAYDPDNKIILDFIFNGQSSWVADLMTNFNPAYGIHFTITYDVHNCGSDYHMCRDFGCTAIFTHSEHANGVHTPEDTMEKVSFPYAEKNGQLGLVTLAALAEVLDTTAPSTVDDYNGLWHNSDFTIGLSAVDDVGAASTYYRVNGGPTLDVSVNGHPSITVESAGNTLEYWSVDSSGNEESSHKMLTQVKLYKSPPSDPCKLTMELSARTQLL